MAAHRSAGCRLRTRTVPRVSSLISGTPRPGYWAPSPAQLRGPPQRAQPARPLAFRLHTPPPPPRSGGGFQKAGPRLSISPNAWAEPKSREATETPLRGGRSIRVRCWKSREDERGCRSHLWKTAGIHPPVPAPLMSVTPDRQAEPDLPRSVALPSVLAGFKTGF